MQKKAPKPLSKILKDSAIRALWIVAIVFLVYWLQGCGNERLASVEERQVKSSGIAVNDDDDYSAVDEKINQYRVRAGDTLYSIAFRFGLDYRTLAKVNNIDSSYFIKIDQILDIDAARSYREVTTTQVAQIETRKSETTTTASTVIKPIVQKPNTKPKPGTNNKPRGRVTPATKPRVISKKPSKSPQVADSNNPVKFWIWPNMGKVAKTFIATGKKGIDITGNIGDPIRASAAGRVVYAGRGLRGYGNLIIIKHNSSFISAYAHNRRLLVKENEIIKAGQKIAEMGNSDTDLPKLHFEIRYKGKPIDPLQHLPKR